MLISDLCQVAAECLACEQGFLSCKSISANPSKQFHFKPPVHTVAAGKIEGDVRINGYPKEQASFARVSGYVEQFDTHTAAASVYEALLFSGTLRNGKEVDPKTTKAFVDQVIMPVRLQDIYQSHVHLVKAVTSISLACSPRKWVELE
jgi:hypothetical protein